MSDSPIPIDLAAATDSVSLVAGSNIRLATGVWWRRVFSESCPDLNTEVGDLLQSLWLEVPATVHQALNQTCALLSCSWSMVPKGEGMVLEVLVP